MAPPRRVDASAASANAALQNTATGSLDMRSAASAQSLPILRSSIDVNVATLDVSTSFQQLDEPNKLRLMHLYKALTDVQKVAFLQCSPETPVILLFFQELFYAPGQKQTPGELLLELQKRCNTNGMSDEVAKFLQYLALFYANLGNYDQVTGVKIVPDLSKSQFQRILNQAQGRTEEREPRVRVLRLLEACVNGVFDPMRPQHDTLLVPGGDQGRKTLCHPLAHAFYPHVLPVADVWRVDDSLEQRQISLFNTRIIRKEHSNGRTVAFTVLRTQASPSVRRASLASDVRASVSVARPANATTTTSTTGSPTKPNAKDSSGKDSKDNAKDSGKDNAKDAQSVVPTVYKETWRLNNGDDVYLVDGDYVFFINRLLKSLQVASAAAPPPKLLELLVQSLQRSKAADWDAVLLEWQTAAVNTAQPTVFTLGFCPVSIHRDVLHRRKALEGFLALRNRELYDRTQSILERDLDAIVRVLPFRREMQARSLLATTRFDCLDMMLTTHYGVAVPLARPLHVVGDGKTAAADGKVVLLTNCMDKFAKGEPSYEKTDIMDNCFETKDAKRVQQHYDQLLYAAFVLEELVAPATVVLLTETAPNEFNFDKDHVVCLPPELLEHDQTDGDDYDDVDGSGTTEYTSSELEQLERHWAYSSFAQRVTQWYKPGETVATKFMPQVAEVLEASRRSLVALLAVCDVGVVDRIVLRDWKTPTSLSDDTILELDESVIAVDDDQPDSGTRKDTRHAALQLTMSFWLVALRDALWGLMYYSDHRYTWDNARAQARFMVLRMLQSDLDGRALDDEDRLFRLQPTYESKDKPTITALKVHLEVRDSRSAWLRSARLHARRWLQRLQWIQMTGDATAVTQWFHTFAQVNDTFLLCWDHLHWRLTAIERKRKKEQVATVSKKAATLAVTTMPPGTEQAMNVRTKVAHLLNASNFGHETVWIPPALRLVNVEVQEPEASTPTTPVPVPAPAPIAAPPVAPTSSPSPPSPSAKKSGKKSSTKDETKQQTKQAQPTPTQPVQPTQPAVPLLPAQTAQNASSVVQKVMLKVYKPDLRHAVEAAIVRFGVLQDEEVEAIMELAQID